MAADEAEAAVTSAGTASNVFRVPLARAITSFRGVPATHCSQVRSAFSLLQGVSDIGDTFAMGRGKSI